MPEARSKCTRLFELVVVASVAFAVFAPAVGFAFVYDDHWTVEGNPALSSALAPLLRALASGHAALRGIPDATRPAMVVSLWLDRHAFGMDPAGYHLHSLLLYALVTAVATLAVFAVTRRRLAALAGGLFFALMPVHAEVVAAVNYREDLYAALGVFSVVAWLFWPRRRPEFVDHAVLVAAVLFVGLSAKESAVVVAPLVLVLAAVRGRARQWASSRRVSLVAFAAVIAAFVAWRGFLHQAGRDDVPLVLVHRGPLERVLRTARYAVRGVVDGLWPFGFSPDYAPEPTASAYWLVPLAACVLFIVLLSRTRRGGVFAQGVAVALVAPLVTSPLLSPINETADRYVFVATLGGAIVWGTLIARAKERLPPRFLRAPALALLVVLFLLSRRAAAPWRTDLSLWQAATERAPTSPRAWTGLAHALRVGGDLDGADRAVLHAIELDPKFLRARVTHLYNSLARGEVGRARLEIEAIDRLGGSRQRGMRQARKCADLTPGEAVKCVGFAANQAVPTSGDAAD